MHSGGRRALKRGGTEPHASGITCHACLDGRTRIDPLRWPNANPCSLCLPGPSGRLPPCGDSDSTAWHASGCHPAARRTRADRDRAPVRGRHGWHRGCGWPAAVRVRALHWLAARRHTLRLLARHHAERDATHTDRVSSRCATCDRGVGSRVWRHARRRSAATLHPLRAGVWGVRSPSCDSGACRPDLRPRGHGGDRHPSDRRRRAATRSTSAVPDVGSGKGKAGRVAWPRRLESTACPDRSDDRHG